MNGARLLILGTLSIFAGTFFQGCGLVRGIMSASYHVATEPVRAIQRGVTRPTPGAKTTTTTTTVTRTTKTGASDVSVPGHPVASSSSTPQRPGRAIRTSSGAASPAPAPKVARTDSTRRKSKVSQKRAVSSQQATAAQSGYPTAKPVADKPGYVFSPFDPKGRYVDVSGYAPGSKVKDPWTDRIFIVP